MHGLAQLDARPGHREDVVAYVGLIGVVSTVIPSTFGTVRLTVFQ